MGYGFKEFNGIVYTNHKPDTSNGLKQKPVVMKEDTFLSYSKEVRKEMDITTRVVKPKTNFTHELVL